MKHGTGGRSVNRIAGARVTRRDLLAGISGALASSFARPERADATISTTVKHIAVLMAYPKTNSQAFQNVAAFGRKLQALGWSESDNLRITRQWATPEMDTVRRLAADAVALRPDLLVCSGARSTIAAARLTSTIPIVFASAADPIACGFVESLLEPRTNVTGIMDFEPRRFGLCLTLLKQIAPRVARILVPYDPEALPYAASYLKAASSLTAVLGITPVATPLRDIAGLATLLDGQPQGENVGLAPLPDGFMNANSEEIVALATRYRIPAVYFARGFSDAGGLISYGSSSVENWRGAALYSDRILRGERPDALAVARPKRFELVVNLKTAGALGLVVPQNMLARADTLIA